MKEKANDPIQEALEKKLCELSFYEFFKKAWHIIEPSIPLSTNWHHHQSHDRTSLTIYVIHQQL